MTRTTTFGASCILLSALFALPASADVTPEDVWQLFKENYTNGGLVITTGSEKHEGDTLVIRDIVATQTLSETDQNTFTWPELRLRDVGDGSVEVTIPAENQATMSTKTAEGPPIVTTFQLTQAALAAQFSGTPDAIASKFGADEVAFRLGEAKVNGEDLPMKVLMKLNGLSGTSSFEGMANKDMRGEAAAKSLDMTITAADKDGGTLNLTATINDITSTATGIIAIGATDPNAALQSGQTMAQTLSYASSIFNLASTLDGQTVNADGGSGAGQIDFALSKAGLRYAINASDSKINVSGPMPFPVGLTIANSVTEVAFPISKSDAGQPAALRTTLKDLAISDSLWGMFDPNGALKHDPANLTVDLTGEIRPLVDILDPKQLESFGASGAPAPFQADAVTLNKLHLSILGAELNGQGDVTFDNTGPVPKPLGSVDLDLKGAVQLLNGLAAAGLIPAEQVAGYTMMLGMFTVPAGDDAVKTKVEFREDGIYNNGQKVQ